MCAPNYADHLHTTFYTILIQLFTHILCVWFILTQTL